MKEEDKPWTLEDWISLINREIDYQEKFTLKDRDIKMYVESYLAWFLVKADIINRDYCE